MARRLGEAFVSIEADASLFRASATTGIKKALAGVDGKIPVTADTSRARAQVDLLKTRMENLNRQLAEVKIGANGKPAEAGIRKIQLQLKELADNLASITMEADTTRIDLAIKREEGNLAKLNAKASSLTLDADQKKLTVKIAAAEAGLEKLNEQASHLVIDADTKKMEFQLADMERQAFHLRAALGDPDAIRLEVDERSMEAKLASLEANIAVLQEHMTGMVIDADERLLLRKIYAAEAELRALQELGDVPLIADAVALDAAIASSTAKIAALRAEAADLKIGGKTDLAALAATEGALLGLEEAAKRLNPELDVTSRKLVTGTRGFGRFGLAALGARVALFGGLSAVSGWHIALDAVIEGLAVIVPALVTAAAGLVAFGVAGSDSARAVFNRLQNIHTVSDALNQTIPPMTGHLEALHAVVRPQVWQLYGDAIAVAHTQTGLFEKLAVSTGGVVDNLAARLTVMATTSGTGLNKFLSAGSRDLAEFGRIFLSLGDAFGKLIQVTEQTHIAETLLSIVGAAAKLFDIFTKIPLPLLATVVAVHGIWLWSGLAATGITALLRPFGRLAAAAAGAKLAGTAVQDLAASGSDSRIARLGATFKDLGTNLRALPGRVVSLGKALVGLFTNPWTWVAIGAVALVGLVVALARSKSATDRFVDSISTMVAHSSDLLIINTLGASLLQTNQKLAEVNSQVSAGLKTMRDRMHSASAEAVQYGTNQNQLVGSARELTGLQHKLSGELSVVTGHLSSVAQAFGTDGLAGAMALAHLAGVSVNELLSKDSKVWDAAVQKIAGVVQGYANMGVGATGLGNAINVLTISQSDQLKNMETLNSAYDQFTKIVSGPVTGFLSFANTLKRFSNDAGVAGASISGLGTGMTKVSKKMTDASLQLQSDFQDTFSAAAQMADAMRLTGVASDKQVSSIKDVVQVMIPMAGSNKAAAAEISSLAQEAGGPATTNLKELGKWAGKTKDPLAKAQKAAADAAIAFFNMSQDAQKLGTALSQDLTTDMAKAVENAIGLQGAMDKFAKDLQKGTDVTAAGHTDRKQLYDDLFQVTGSGKQADAIIKAMTDRLHSHGSALDNTAKARAQFNADLKTILDRAPGVRGDIKNLVDQSDTWHSTLDKGRSARDKLIRDLEATGVDSKTAQKMVHDLQGEIDGMHGKSVKVGVNFVGSGTGSIAFKESIPGVTTGPSSQGILGFHAAGGMISGGTPGKDSVLGVLMPGEVVVPTSLVQAGAVDHLRGRLPGFASGGVVGDVMSHATGSGGIMPSGQSFMQNAEEGFGRAVEQAFAKAVIAKFKKDMNTLGGSGPAIVNYARSFLGQIPYVFGGNSLSGGIDCSGFTQQVYGKFGIHAPRTSEGQYAWATRSAPVPGALAFYVSPAGGPPPGHVAIVQDGSSVISQGGGMGPKVESLNFMPLMGTGVPKGGFPSSKGGSGNQAIGGGALQAIAMSLLRQYGWGNQWNSFNSLENSEGGWRLDARNPRSGAYGLAQFIDGPSEYFQYGGNPNTGLGQLTAMDNYIASRYVDPNAAWAFHQRNNYYAGGGLVGMAAGGKAKAKARSPSAAQIASQGSAYLKAWKTRHGGGFGAAWGPIPVNPQIDAMNAAIHRADTLSHATGLSAGQHRWWAGKEADEKKRLKTLTSERAIERTWRTNLTGSDTALASYIKAAGHSPSLAKNVTQWKAQLNRQKGTISSISAMLGLSAAQVAAAEKAGQLGPGGKPLPKITHTFGGDVGNTIGAYLSSVMSPLGMARGGMVKSYDKGGWLAPGLTMAYNGTGRNEPVGGAAVNITFEVESSGSEFDRFMVGWLAKKVKVKGAGDVQSAFGQPNIRFVRR